VGLLTRCAHACVRKMLREVAGLPRAHRVTVAALQTFGSYAATFHPHVHALVADGVFAPHGSFERVRRWDQQALRELFRRLVLVALLRDQRLIEETRLQLLGWMHSGFSVHVGPPILPDETRLLEHLAR
jgi:hypothetical protein